MEYSASDFVVGTLMKFGLRLWHGIVCQMIFRWSRRISVAKFGTGCLRSQSVVLARVLFSITLLQFARRFQSLSLALGFAGRVQCGTGIRCRSQLKSSGSGPDFAADFEYYWNFWSVSLLISVVDFDA